MFIILQYASLLSSFVQAVITAILISATPKASTLRLLAIPSLVFLAYYQFVYATCFSGNVVYNAVIACAQFAAVIHYIDLLLITNIDVSDLVREQLLDLSGGSFSRVFHAIRITYNVRGVGTRWQAKNTPSFPKYFSQSSPSRGRFLLRQTVIFIWQYLLIDVFDATRKQQSPEDVKNLYAPGAESLFLNATAEQLGARIAVSLMAWFIFARIIIDSVYRLLSLIFVGIGLSSPSNWPPFFGSLWDAYTLRSFWGKFWHQSLRWSFTSLSSFLTRDLLKLPRPSIIERYTNILLVFTMSGIYHVFNDLSMGISLADSGAMLFFQSFAFGFMLEDAVQYIWGHLGAKYSIVAEDAKSPFWKRVVGFTWVMSWMCFTAPWYIYPANRLPVDSKWLVPYSVVDIIGMNTVLVAIGVGAVLLKVVFRASL